jgi:Ca2+-transporting ATPase
MDEAEGAGAAAGRKGAKRAGLTRAEVAASRARQGWNELPRAKPTAPIVIFLRQFKGLLVLILAAAAAIAFSLGETVDAAAIALVLVLNAVLGFVQEWRAETALDALRSMLSPKAVVVRDGVEQVVAAREIVPGDLVIVDAGEAVPADLQLEAGIEVRADESVMTGESVPVDKLAGGGDGAGTLFAGTTLVGGRAEGVAIATGTATEFGGIATLTASVDRKETHLQRRLGQLAIWLGGISVLVAALIVGIGVFVGRPAFEMFMTGLSLAVAMVPEGLPAVVTVTLAIGASTMARRKALARRLQAVETLGAASVICTDKTGTLTENQMTATRIWTPGQDFEVTGTGYDPTGHIAIGDTRVRAGDSPALARLLQTALICTHASLNRAGDEWQMVGTPTEGALVTLAMKGWASTPDEGRRVAELPFSSERKRMSVLARDGAGYRLYTKGAPEVLLDLCSHVQDGAGIRPMTEADRKAADAALHDMGERGQRVIALASREAAGNVDLDETGLTLLGLVGLIDPPRSEVSRAIALARSAGIRVIMITGDSPVTASAIARDIGLGEARPIIGHELDAMDQDALVDLLEGDVLFARTKPEHKMRIVDALQSLDQIVAMTGDGVNDAPALKQANIGIAMGIRGTDVSKGAADLILLDDNFATIVRAIAEGRRQYENVKKFVRYLLCSNAGEVLAIVVNLLIGGPLIFLATQILWMNLITDGVTAVALGLEKGEADQMRRPPRALNEPIVGRHGVGLIAMFGLYTGAASLWVFYTFLPMGADVARTAAFTAMVLFEKFSVFAFRSLTQPNWKIGWASNPLLLIALTISISLQIAAVYWPPLQGLLKTVPLAAEHWLTFAVLALPLVIVPELIKTVRRARSRT